MASRSHSRHHADRGYGGGGGGGGGGAPPRPPPPPPPPPPGLSLARAGPAAATPPASTATRWISDGGLGTSRATSVARRRRSARLASAPGRPFNRQRVPRRNNSARRLIAREPDRHSSHRPP